MIKTATLAALAAFAIPTAAAAQSAPTTGVRVELMIGVEKFKDNLGVDSDQFNPEFNRDINAAIGAGVGYDFVRGDALSVGVDAEYVRASAKEPVFVNGVRNGDLKYGSEVYGGGRVTFAVSPSINLVGKVGYSFLDTEYTSDTLASSRDSNTSGIRGALGVQFGGGGDDRSYYGLEGRYTDYEGGLSRKSLMLSVGYRF